MSGQVLITGGAGYIGGLCALELLKAGRDIVIFDNFSTGNEKTADILRNCGTAGRVAGCERGDLRSYADINAVFRKYRIDAALHFAAFSQVGESASRPQDYYINNVGGSMNLFRAMMEAGVKKLVFSSSAAVYGEPEYTPVDEEHPLGPINVYGRTKLFIEKILDDYDAAYGLRSVRLRYFNAAGAADSGVLGERHDPETHLIPNILKSVSSPGRKFEIYGDDYPTRDGTCVRDYVDVRDLASAHLLALDYLAAGGPTDRFNLGTAAGSSVKEVFAACEAAVGEKISFSLKPRRPGDPAVLVADSGKAGKILGWKPEKTLSDSINAAWLWEKKTRAGVK